MTTGSVVAAARRRAGGGTVRVAAAELPARRIYQRASGAAAVSLSGTYTGTASAVAARVLNAQTSTEVVGWTTVAASPASGTWSGTLSVPQGGWYRMQYRLSAEPAAVVSAVNTFGVGDVWVLAGQNQQARLSTLVNAAPTPDDKTAYFTGGTSWSLPGVVPGTGGNGGIRFLNLMTAATGVPQGCLQVSVEDSAITDWEPGDAPYVTATARLTELGTVAGILWHQGGTGIGTVTRADYKTRLAALRTGFATAATVQRFAVFPLMHRTNVADTDFYVQETRRAHYEYLAENLSTINLGWTPDVPLADDVHQTAAGSEIIAYAYAHALLFSMNIETVNNLGPLITQASRSGATVTLTVQHRSGTSLKTATGAVPTGFQVFPRSVSHSDAAALPISTISLGTGTISITLASDPASAVDVYYQWGRFDATAPVFDNTQALGRTTGNPLQPLMTPIESPAEAGTVVNPSLKLDGTTGSLRYPLTSGWYLPNDNWTMGLWCRIDNPAGAQSQYLISAGPYGGSETFNLLMYEAGHAKAGAVEFILRGAEASGPIVSGPNTPAFLDTQWRLFVVERVKATETINIYHAVPGADMALYHSGSSAGLGAVTPTTPIALGTRAPPISGSERWLDGALHSTFRMDGLLTASERNLLSRGSDLISNLGKSPALYSKLNTLTTPIANSGTLPNVPVSLSGGITLTTGPAFQVSSSAVQFDEAGLIYSMPKTTSHNLPAGEWTLGFMMALDDNAGNVAQYIYSTGTFLAAECVNVSIGEEGNPVTANKMAIAIDDGGGSIDAEFITPSLAALIDGKYYLWTIENDAATGTLKVYYTPTNGQRVLFHNAVLPAVLGALTPPTATVVIGTRQDAPATRYFGGKMHMAFQMDGMLTAAQTRDLARGHDLVTSLALAPRWYHKFSSAATTLTDLSGNGNTATASGGTPVAVPGPTFIPNG